MKDSKNKRTMIMVVILAGLLIVAYKAIFMGSSDITDNTAASGANALIISKEIESINFDTSVIKDQTFQSLKSIEVPILPLPIGRANPFSSVGSN